MQPFPAVSSGNRALEEASAFKAIKDSQPSKLYFAECQKFRIIYKKDKVLKLNLVLNIKKVRVLEPG